MPEPYASAFQLREHLGDLAILNDGLLSRAVQAASRAVDSYTGRRFWADDSPTVRRYRPLSDRVYVSDIASTTGLVVKEDNGSGTFSTTLTIDVDFELCPLNADVDGWAWDEIRAISRSFPSQSRASVEVTALHGWPAVPQDVETATILKAAALFQRKDSPAGVAGFGDFGVVRIGRQQDPHVAELLAPYCKPGFA